MHPGTQEEALAGKRPEVVVPTFRVGITEPGHALKMVPAGTNPLTELLDALKTEYAVGVGVLLIILCAEVGEMPFKDGMQLVTTTGNVAVRRHGRDEDCRAHITLYRRIGPPASRGDLHLDRQVKQTVQETTINRARSPS